ncbi:Kelch repeat-containing protein [Amycolatopsis sp. NPDC049868]|uniref:Kelch repeat-containing protein n=1 Tax=Amycolatopsis sp. NPDC049868 TaxID=3363934 RepID=UPI0037B71785
MTTSTGGWTRAGELPPENAAFDLENAMVRLDDGRVLLAGGTDAVTFEAIAAAALFDPASPVWKPTGSLATTRRLHTMTVLPNKNVLATGGIEGPFRFPPPAVGSVEIYDVDSGKWGPARSMSEPRFGHTATLLPNGKVLVAGGLNARDAKSNHTLASAELYDPETDTWSVTGSMHDARAESQAVLLPDGRVLVAGGWHSTGPWQGTSLSYCEIYTPATGSWEPTGSMATPRGQHQATGLADGSVLVTGGFSRGFGPGPVLDWHSLASTELYDAATGIWRPAEPMPWGLDRHRAVLLRDGGVLIVGGTDEGSLSGGYAGTIVYDPAARTWAGVGGLSEGRYGHAALLLDDGRVLVAGGLTAAQLAASPTEVFTP